ncbi:methyltransferase domain protein [Rhodococcus sp. MTM3W5.2]|nr:methyltransferase domain protein [Rhodococcus sp. MTM3W5.2]
MLASALAASVTPEAEVLDFCCGSGALAMVAARAGAAKVTAVDRSSLAAGVAWANARGRGLPIRVRRGGLAVAVSEGPFDVVVSNPPYVPSPRSGSWVLRDTRIAGTAARMGAQSSGHCARRRSSC